jgi:hypothetical protein
MLFRKLRNGGEIEIQQDQLGGKMAKRSSKVAAKARKPEKFTCLDIAFKNNDQLKTNTALQMESAKIEFKVI